MKKRNRNLVSNQVGGDSPVETAHTCLWIGKPLSQERVSLCLRPYQWPRLKQSGGRLRVDRPVPVASHCPEWGTPTLTHTYQKLSQAPQRTHEAARVRNRAPTCSPILPVLVERTPLLNAAWREGCRILKAKVACFQALRDSDIQDAGTCKYAGWKWSFCRAAL